MDLPRESSSQRRGRPGWPVRMLVLAVTVAAIYLAYCGLFAVLKTSLVFPWRGREEAGLRQAPPAGFERWTQAVAGVGELEAWWHLGVGRSATQPGPVVLFFHGNGEIMDFRTDLAEAYAALGVSVLLVEYRGYGRNPGEPVLPALHDDHARWFDAVAAHPAVARGQVAVHGYSIGAAMATQLARRRPVAAQWLEAPFTSLGAMARRYGVWLYLASDPLDNVAALRDFGGPVLVLHGGRDGLIPVAMGEAVAQAAPRGRLVVYPEGAHSTPVDGAQIDRLRRAWLDEWRKF